MNALDESMDEKLERLERENEQLHKRISEMQSLLCTAFNELAACHHEKQELMDALGPFVTGTWVPLQTLKFAKATYDKHYESMT